MLSGSSDHLFLDISTIDCRETNISFSVEHLLNNEYYPARPLAPQNIRPKPAKDAPSRPASKPRDPNTPRARKQGSRALQPQSRQPSKHRDALEDKDTYDSSQTVKIVHCRPAPKDLPPKKGPQPPDRPAPAACSPASNKFQPAQQRCSRSKSGASLQAQRRWSQAKQDLVGKAVSSNISLSRNPSLEKLRSETQRGPTEAAKARNEHIVRKDYFEEKEGRPREGAEVGERAGGKGAESGKQKATSASRKTLVFKKERKGLPPQASSGQWEKLNPKSPRLKK